MGFVNSNANWDCEKASSGSLPPAVCSMRGFGGLTINLLNDTTAGATLSAPNRSGLEAEQRMLNGSFYTRRYGPVSKPDRDMDGSTDGTYELSTETVIHSSQNCLLTRVWFKAEDPNAVTQSGPDLHTKRFRRVI